MSAWARDARHLAQKLEATAELLSKCTCSFDFGFLVVHLQKAREVCLASVGSASRFAHNLRVSTPVARPRRLLGALHVNSLGKGAVKHDSSSTRTSFPCIFGTFGWWEIIQPNEKAIASLCELLSSHHVLACAVTGFPGAGLEESLGGRFGYSWFGDISHMVGQVGVLVATPWKHCISFVKPCGEVSPRRIFFIAPGPVLCCAAYGPCVGAIPVDQHQVWLLQTIVTLRDTAAHYGVHDFWLFSGYWQEEVH